MIQESPRLVRRDFCEARTTDRPELAEDALRRHKIRAAAAAVDSRVRLDTGTYFVLAGGGAEVRTVSALQDEAPTGQVLRCVRPLEAHRR